LDRLQHHVVAADVEGVHVLRIYSTEQGCYTTDIGTAGDKK